MKLREYKRFVTFFKFITATLIPYLSLIFILEKDIVKFSGEFRKNYGSLVSIMVSAIFNFIMHFSVILSIEVLCLTLSCLLIYFG